MQCLSSVCEHKSEELAAGLPDSQVVIWHSDHPISVQLCALHAEFQSLLPLPKISVYLQSLTALPELVFSSYIKTIKIYLMVQIIPILQDHACINIIRYNHRPTLA